MHGDLSRITFDPTKLYSSVRSQQGRATLDADGVPQLTKVRRIAPVAGGVDAIALSAGTLSTVEKEGPQGAGFYNRTLSPAQAPTSASDPVWVGRESGR